MQGVLQQFITQVRLPAEKGTVSGVPECAHKLMLDTVGGNADSCYPVSDFSQAGIAAAVHEVLCLRKAIWGIESPARVNRMLASRWCKRSVYPDDWELPASWDDFAGDYQTRDGWIRLHTNALHHRVAALGVLGNPATRQDAAQRVAGWQGLDLENAVVKAGGAAAVMMTREAWLSHEHGQVVNREPVVIWRERAAMKEGTDLLKQATRTRPLAGVRVLDLTRVLAGPVSTRFLASLGAEVLRIDPPGWDEDVNAIEMTLGKRCAGLDLKKPADKKAFEALLAKAHVIVHGYRRDALPQLGFDDTRRAEINPGLIDIALNAYGWEGPWARRRGFDSLVQMSSGIADSGMQSAAAQRPVPLPFQALDHVTGYLMAAAVIHAITWRCTSGRVYSARLSLARQAQLLQELRPSGAIGVLAEVEDKHFSPIIEHTPWGKLRRLQLPYWMDGVNLEFDHPVNRLRSGEARWLDG